MKWTTASWDDGRFDAMLLNGVISAHISRRQPDAYQWYVDTGYYHSEQLQTGSGVEPSLEAAKIACAAAIQQLVNELLRELDA